MYKINQNITLALAVFCISCNNELVLTETGSPIPITYAVFDSKDTAHYVRLEKSFVDENIPPAELAKDPSKLYYTSPKLELVNKRTNKKYNFIAIDGEKEGYPRQEGPFAKVPNRLYKLKNIGADWNTDDDYQLNITANESTSFNGITKMVGQGFLIRPREDAAIDFDDTQSIRYSWNSGKNASVYSMKLVLRISESVNNAPFVKKTIVWPLFSNIENTRFDFNGREFYALLATNLTKATFTKRFFDGIDVVFTAGGTTISDYLKVSTANLGITASGEVPTFTNFSAGRGLIGSVARTDLRNLVLSRNTVDRLKTNELTRELNFQ
jgi:hypothetical protein